MLNSLGAGVEWTASCTRHLLGPPGETLHGQPAGGSGSRGGHERMSPNAGENGSVRDEHFAVHVVVRSARVEYPNAFTDSSRDEQAHPVPARGRVVRDAVVAACRR